MYIYFINTFSLIYVNKCLYNHREILLAEKCVLNLLSFTLVYSVHYFFN